MIRSPVDDSRVHVSLRTARKSVEKVRHQFRLQVSYQPDADLRVGHRLGASGKIDCHDSQSFIHWHYEISGAQNAPFGPQCLRKSLAKSNADVFHRVVLINIEVAVRPELKIEGTMIGKQFEH